MTADLVRRLRAFLGDLGEDWRTGHKFLRSGTSRSHIDIMTEAADRIEALEAVAKQAADWFEEYEKIHAAKGDIESDAKARRNADRAAFCRAHIGAIAALEAAAAQPSEREAALVKAVRTYIDADWMTATELADALRPYDTPAKDERREQEAGK